MTKQTTYSRQRLYSSSQALAGELEMSQALAGVLKLGTR